MSSAAFARKSLSINGNQLQLQLNGPAAWAAPGITGCNVASLCNVSGDMRLLASGGHGLTVQAWTGHVGIGSSVPVCSLDVSGTIRATSFIGPTQWSTNASSVYIAGSNVGIGSSTPAYPLDVSGTVRATAVLGSGASQWSNNGTNVFIAGSNIGIGRSVPAYPLDISGNVRVMGQMQATSYVDGSGNPIIPVTLWTNGTSAFLHDGGTGLDVGTGGGLTSRYFWFGAMVTAEIRMTLGASSNLGTTSNGWCWTLPVPAATSSSDCVIGTSLMRDIYGRTCYTGVAYCLSNGLSVKSFIGAVSDVGITCNVPFTWTAGDTVSLLLTYEASVVQVPLGATPLLLQSVATNSLGLGILPSSSVTSNSFIVAGQLGVGGVSLPVFPIDVSGTVRASTFIGSGAGLTGLSGVNVVGGSQWTTNAYNVYIAGGSNVGIGMSTPAYPLDISGTVRATAFVGSGAGLTGLAVPSPWTTITSNAVIAAGSNVGIGTNTPVAALHVVGNTLVTGDITAFYSDDRLKRRVGDIQDALGLLNGLSTFRYAPNETAMQAGFPDKIGLGLSAQEVRAVLPEIVGQAPFDVSGTSMDSKSGLNYLTIQYERMVPVLVQAVRELNQEVKQLRRDEHNWRLLTLCVPILSAIFIYSLFPVFASTSSGVSSYKYTA